MGSIKPYMESAKPYMESARVYIGSAQVYMESAKPYMESARVYMESANTYMESAWGYMESANAYMGKAGVYMGHVQVYMERVWAYIETIDDHTRRDNTRREPMAKIQLENISAEKAAQLIKLGQGYGSGPVKTQAEQILGAFTQHKGVVVRYGFTEEDAEEIAELVTMYPANLGERANKKVGRTVTSTALRAQVKGGKQARLRGRAMLEAVGNRLVAGQTAAATDPKAEAGRLIAATLAQTDAVSREVDALLAQLRLIAHCWTSKAIATEAAKRGGDEVIALLQTQIQTLDASLKDLQQATTTSADTQRLDLIDGLIIERVREASRAAKVAAKVEGNPALADAFKLKHLYG